MKKSNKNNIHKAVLISRHNFLVDVDKHNVYGKVRRRKSGRHRRRVREIEYTYGVNKELNKANSRVYCVDSRCDLCCGYDYHDHV